MSDESRVEGCASCQFVFKSVELAWSPDTDKGVEQDRLQCRRFPPQGMHPDVGPDGWCGEWSPIKGDGKCDKCGGVFPLLTLCGAVGTFGERTVCGNCFTSHGG